MLLHPAFDQLNGLKDQIIYSFDKNNADNCLKNTILNDSPV
jgi:hypothetical protein